MINLHNNEGNVYHVNLFVTNCLLFYVMYCTLSAIVAPGNCCEVVCFIAANTCLPICQILLMWMTETTIHLCLCCVLTTGFPFCLLALIL